MWPLEQVALGCRSGGGAETTYLRIISVKMWIQPTLLNQLNEIRGVEQKQDRPKGPILVGPHIVALKALTWNLCSGRVALAVVGTTITILERHS